MLCCLDFIAWPCLTFIALRVGKLRNKAKENLKLQQIVVVIVNLKSRGKNAKSKESLSYEVSVTQERDQGTMMHCPTGYESRPKTFCLF